MDFLDYLMADLSSWVTAFATAALAFLTLALVIATGRMVREMARPHVVANLEMNQWSLMHFDLVVENCGNAPAYDVSIKIDPPIDLAAVKGDAPMPFTNISIIRPAQTYSSYVADFKSIEGKVFKLEISWKRRPKSWRTESLSYELNMKSFDGISQLGKNNPMIQVAEQLKHMRNDWKSVANGQRKLSVDMFDQDDRNEARRVRDEQFAEMKAERDAKSAKKE